MPCRCGITTRPRQRPAELRGQFRNPRDLTFFGPFRNRAKADAWETEMRAFCSAPPGGAYPASRRRRWYGYCFQHDGERTA